MSKEISLVGEVSRLFRLVPKEVLSVCIREFFSVVTFFVGKK